MQYVLYNQKKAKINLIFIYEDHCFTITKTIFQGAENRERSDQILLDFNLEC